ncbi:hypothetical protein B0T21DRAFT_416019 [Apiosordaria backusii]|uniref:Uncharacterized protein n=1 Tax=Apiosordaria backusii TaxID=314023 RepID=A0AA40DR76_9PEZI|nr:hypothetical protein B0T21DRAFT_416019 [Apiosordaria backusii]
MKFQYLLTILGATVTMAAPPKGLGLEPVDNGLELRPLDNVLKPVDKESEGGCIPASCTSFGCCSGGCGYWCRACGIDFNC